MHAVETLFSVPPARSIHPLCRCNASRTVLKHTASHSSTSMLREAPNGLPAGEVSSFGRHTLNTPPASQPQHPQSAPRPYPLERHPPPPRWSLHLTSRGGRDRKVSTTSRRLAGEIHDDASSSGGRPSGPRVRPDAPVARIAASSGKRGHAPATGYHFAGRPFRQRPWGPLPNVAGPAASLARTAPQPWPEPTTVEP